MSAGAQGGVGFAAVLRIPGARQLIAGTVIGRMPIGMLSLASLLLIHDEYGSFALAGLVVGALAVGNGVAAPFQGGLIDRYGARRVLPPIAIGEGIATAGFAAAATMGTPRPVAVLLGFVVGSLTPPLSATLRMVWMHVIADGPVRDAAFALDAMTTQLLFGLGPLVTAVTVQLSSPAAAVVIAGIITVVGTLTFAASAPIKAGGQALASARAARAGLGESLPRTAVLTSPGLLVVLVMVLLVGWGSGSLEVGLAALAVHLGSPAAAGVLVGAWCGGGVVGGWFYGQRVWNASISVRHQVAAAAAALLTLPLLLAGSIPIAILISLVAGAPWAALYACQYRMVAEHAPPHAATEAFTWNITAIVAGAAIGSALGGILISRFGASACFIQTAAVVATILGWDRLVRNRQPAR